MDPLSVGCMTCLYTRLYDRFDVLRDGPLSVVCTCPEGSRYICVVGKYVDHMMPRSVRSSGRGTDAHGGAFPKGLAWLGVINPDAMLFR